MPSPMPAEAVYDLIGLGFGPANIAIGGAIVEKWASAATTVRPPPTPISSVSGVCADGDRMVILVSCP